MTSRVRICVPVCVSHLSEIADGVRAASEVADIVELRLDYLAESELDHFPQTIQSILKSLDRQVIFTLRPAEYGGARPITAKERLYFRLQNPNLLRTNSDDLWDLELDLALLLQQRAREGNDVQSVCDWRRTICSYHDFAGVPDNLETIYESMAQTESRTLKLAVQADDALDCLPVFHLLDRAHREDREMIAIAMGQAGVMTRILGPSRGAFLTFGSLGEENGTAPGQPTAHDLRDLYRIDSIDRDTQIFGVIGRPVSHSLSPYIHNASFATLDLNAVFISFDAGEVVGFIRRMIHPKTRELDLNVGGLSVTAPHKSMVMQSLDWIDSAARDIGAVNTIVVHDTELHGYNTDAAGFLAPLRKAIPDLANARCAVIGAGGAARAAIWALKKEGADVTVFAREKTKGEFLSKAFGVKYQQLSARSFAGHDLIVNSTPLGTRGDRENETIVTTEQLRGVRLAYDLVYNPSETRFLREAAAAGCQAIGGLEMLIAQAVEQFKLWTGKQPDVNAMRSAATRRLGIE